MTTPPMPPSPPSPGLPRSTPAACKPRGLSILAAAVLLVAAAVVAGCNTAQLDRAATDVRLARGDIAALRGELVAAQGRAQAARVAAETQPAGPGRDALLAVATASEQAAEKAGPVLAQAEKVAQVAEAGLRAAASGDGLAGVESTITTAVGFIPGWGTVAGLLVTTIFGFIRAGMNRAAARAIAKSVELAQGADGVLNLDNEATQEDLRTIQGAGGSRIVDEAQGKATRLPF